MIALLGAVKKFLLWRRSDSAGKGGTIDRAKKSFDGYERGLQERWAKGIQPNVLRNCVTSRCRLRTARRGGERREEFSRKKASLKKQQNAPHFFVGDAAGEKLGSIFGENGGHKRNG
jgi:hypothetical protein